MARIVSSNMYIFLKMKAMLRDILLLNTTPIEDGSMFGSVIRSATAALDRIRRTILANEMLVWVPCNEYVLWPTKTRHSTWRNVGGGIGSTKALLK